MDPEEQGWDDDELLEYEDELLEEEEPAPEPMTFADAFVPPSAQPVKLEVPESAEGFALLGKMNADVGYQQKDRSSELDRLLWSFGEYLIAKLRAFGAPLKLFSARPQ